MAEQAENTEEEPKSSKKMIMIIAIVVLLLAGGGGAYFLMGGEEPAAEGENAEQAEAKAEEEAEAEAEEGEQQKVLAYYDLEQPLRVNFPKGGRASLIEIRLSFLTEDPKAEELLKKHNPMIVNNLLMAISAAGSEKLASKEGKQELQKIILKEVNKVMDKMTGKERVKEVFFTRFVMQ